MTSQGYGVSSSPEGSRFNLNRLRKRAPLVNKSMATASMLIDKIIIVSTKTPFSFFMLDQYKGVSWETHAAKRVLVLPGSLLPKSLCKRWIKGEVLGCFLDEN